MLLHFDAARTAYVFETLHTLPLYRVSKSAQSFFYLFFWKYFFTPFSCAELTFLTLSLTAVVHLKHHLCFIHLFIQVQFSWF